MHLHLQQFDSICKLETVHMVQLVIWDNFFLCCEVAFWIFLWV